MKNRLTCVLALLVPFLALGPLALASANSDQDDNPAPVPIHGVPDFSNIRSQLQALVNARAFHEINHFCAVGYDVGKVASEEADIYWPTQNKILVWFGGDTHSMLNPINYIDIKNDVVKSIDWQHPPGILPWTRADVADLPNDCRHHGNTYTIKRTVGHWIALKKLPQFTLIYRNLEYLVDQEATTEINRFCVVGQKSGGIVDSFVYWETQGRLIFWWPDKERENDPGDLVDEPINIDLKRNLRESVDPDSANFYMRRSYAAQDIRACFKFGEFFVVKKGKWEW